jgi:DNA-binding response OmpR family regulator
MARRRILVVEDDPAIRRVLVDALALAGYEAQPAATWHEGLDAALRDSFHLMLIDLGLPGGNGRELLVRVRAARPMLPAIIVTARGETEDRVRGLQAGADDYVVKPFAVREVLARIEAVLRRSAERPLDVRRVVFDGGAVDLERRELTLAGQTARELSEREVDILRYLANRAGRPVSRDELLEQIWRLPPSRVHTRAVDMHVARVREKLGDDAAAPRVIRTIRGKGYCFLGQTA